jgi:hypothetical protein
MTDENPPDISDKACALFADLIAGRWENAHQALDAVMRQHAATDRIASGWRRLASHTGDFEHMGSPSVRRSGDYTVTDVALTFTAGEAIGRVVHTPAGEVAGLALKFPRRPRLDPRTVRVFTLRNPAVAGLFARF